MLDFKHRNYIGLWKSENADFNHMYIILCRLCAACDRCAGEGGKGCHQNKAKQRGQKDAPPAHIQAVSRPSTLKLWVKHES